MFNKCPDPFKDKVKCETCKHWVDKSDCQVVVFTKHKSFYSPSISRTEEFYCPQDRVKYDRQHMDFSYVVRSYKEFQVTEQGEPIGYVKKDIHLEKVAEDLERMADEAFKGLAKLKVCKPKKPKKK